MAEELEIYLEALQKADLAAIRLQNTAGIVRDVADALAENPDLAVIPENCPDYQELRNLIVAAEATRAAVIGLWKKIAPEKQKSIRGPGKIGRAS